MKLYSALSVIIVIGMIPLAYYVGFTHGEKHQDELHFRFELISNVENYNKLMNGENKEVLDSLALAIDSNVKTYNFYKEKDSYFKGNDAVVRKYIQEANIIQNANSSNFIQVPQAPPMNK